MGVSLSDGGVFYEEGACNGHLISTVSKVPGQLYIVPSFHRYTLSPIHHLCHLTWVPPFVFLRDPQFSGDLRRELPYQSALFFQSITKTAQEFLPIQSIPIPKPSLKTFQLREIQVGYTRV
jgi:hypothetical protein